MFVFFSLGASQKSSSKIRITMLHGFFAVVEQQLKKCCRDKFVLGCFFGLVCVHKMMRVYGGGEKLLLPWAWRVG